MTTYDVQAGTATADMLEALGLDAVRQIKSNPRAVQVRNKANEVEDLGDRVLRFVVSDESTDRMGDIIRQDGWDMRNYDRNPVILWGHDDGQPPIGKTISHGLVDRRGPALAMDVEFAPRKASEFADTVYELAKGGFLKATSVGFLPLETSELTPDEAKAMGLGAYGVEYTKAEMLETSVVSVPANPNAVRDGLKKLVVRGFVGAIDAERFSETLTTQASPAVSSVAWADPSMGIYAESPEMVRTITATEFDSASIPTDAIERLLSAVQANTRELSNLRRSISPELFRVSRRGSHPGDILSGLDHVGRDAVAALDAPLNQKDSK